jgi:hypothetical protein
MANDEWVKHWMDGQMRKVRVVVVKDNVTAYCPLSIPVTPKHGVRPYADLVRDEPAPQPMVPNQFEQLRTELARLKAELAAVRAKRADCVRGGSRAMHAARDGDGKWNLESSVAAAMNRAARHWPGMGGICQLTGRPFGL